MEIGKERNGNREKERKKKLKEKERYGKDGEGRKGKCKKEGKCKREGKFTKKDKGKLKENIPENEIIMRNTSTFMYTYNKSGIFHGVKMSKFS